MPHSIGHDLDHPLASHYDFPIEQAAETAPVTRPTANVAADHASSVAGVFYGIWALEKINSLYTAIDRLIGLSRLREIQFIMGTDQADRVAEIQAALERLEPGEYLLGTGPSTAGIVPLNKVEFILGRRPTLLENPSEALPDCWATDTVHFVPREVSRVHAKIVTRIGQYGREHILFDLNSTRGTFLNQMQVYSNPGITLKHGDVISLGPSGTSTYVYYKVTLDAASSHRDAAAL